MNLIFCSLDTLRADRLGCVGNPRGLTPNLDRIASEGALFTQAYASDIPTQPSHTAVFTGQFGVRTGIVSHFHPAAYLDEETLWMPSLLRRQGYVTGAVDHLFAMKDWFIRGYDDYMPPPGRSRSPGSVINDIGFPWLDQHASEEFYLFLHFWDAHIPYLPPSPFKERFSHGTAGRIDPDIHDKLEGRPSYPLFKQNLYDFLEAMPNLDFIADLYDAEVAYLDFEIGRLFNHLGELGLLDDTMVVLFGDHGENMTEHDSWFDHAGLYDSVTHVPLILWAPGRIPAFETSTMVALVDVLPTVLEVLGLPEAERDRRQIAHAPHPGRGVDPPRSDDVERGDVERRPRRAHAGVEVHQVPPDDHLRARRRRALPPGRRPRRAAQRGRRSTPRWSTRCRPSFSTGWRPTWRTSPIP